jgi:hypothetical protein
MKYMKKLGLGLLPLLILLTQTALVLLPSTRAFADPATDAYLYENQIKFEGFVYTDAGKDTRTNSFIYNWNIYLRPGFTCGDFIILDNPQTSSRIALRDTVVYEGENNPVIGDCRTQSLNERITLIDITSQALCEEVNGTWNVAAQGSGCVLSDDEDAVVRDDTTPDTTETTPETCEESSGGLGWIGCPVIIMLDGTLTWLDSTIQGMLEVDEDKYTNSELKDAWVNFRNIAYIILIPVMLVMVIGTALGFDVFSAYTVKKALPRMVVAVIFITFSWYITSFLISFSNVVGGGILGLMTAPFDVPGNLSIGTLFDGGGIGTTVQWGTTAVGVGALAVLGYFIVATGGMGILIILLYLIPAVGFIFIAYLVLVMRQLFILALVLIAPLAILAWIFPGNDKLWKSWWNVFSKLLIMFPLIMAILGAGRIFAHLIQVSGGEGIDAMLNPLLKLSAYILPYFFIPFTFKFAGGLFANLSGMVNDRGRGIFDRSRNARRGLQKQVHEKTMDADNKYGSGRSGSVYRRAVGFGRNGSFSMTKAGRARWDDNEMRIKEAAADKKNEAGGARGFNDDDASELAQKVGQTRKGFTQGYLAKLQHARDVDGRADLVGKSDDDLKLMAQTALARTENALGAKVGTEAMATAALKFRIAMTNTAYEPGVAGLETMQQDIKQAIDAKLITAVDAAGWMKSNRGRADFSANGFVPTVNFAAGNISAAEQLEGAFRGADPREILGGHQRAVESFAQQAQFNLDRSLASGSQAEVDKALADVANIYDMLSNVSAKKADEFADNVMSRGILQMPVWDSAGNAVIDPGTGTQAMRQVNTTVRVIMNEAKARPAGPNGQQTFLDRRREFGEAERRVREAGGIVEPEEH